MVAQCNCLGCKNIAKHLPKSRRGRECIPTESYGSQFERINSPDGYNENCIPTPNKNIDKLFDRDVKTSDLYRTVNIPDRFERPCTLNGYGSQWKSFNQTTNAEYGWMPPNAHTVPHRYYPRTNEFTELLSKSGMYRNYSLNTVMDKSRI